MTDAGEDLLRALAPQVLASLVRRHGWVGGAEDAVQEALLAAATQWPTGGTPDNPRAWLVTVAGRRLVDHVRADASRRRREEQDLAATARSTSAAQDHDDSNATRAHLLELAGDLDAAREDYREAAKRATSALERRHLTARAGRR
ncbi:sigma factor [Actinokineospora globicatena]|uniref:sigma factor n=1 Tax=Actinokineospora globicatena TaxID=103729 RepID=UPI0024A00DDF|nr:Sigma-70 region 2 [Actinokineospora globicatena]GLW78424.1 hypothetical protein Aglo01_29060 [Actinokineospora globicatena]GLW84912.1 hypothetical protein Aglo02_25520 [Actinokineospora globicatena]